MVPQKYSKMLKIAGFVLLGIVLIEIGALLWLKSQVNRYHSYWEGQAEIATQNSGDKYIYLALGDSAAQGVGATSPGKGYVGLIVKELEQRQDKQVGVINLSTTGDKLGDFINEQLPRIAEFEADLVTVDIGANDMSSYDEVKFENEFRIIAEALPDGTLVANIPFFGGIRRDLQPNVIEANKIIDQLLSEFDGLVKVDLYTPTKEKDRFVNYGPDYFHPNNLGYKNWLIAFKAKL